MVGVEAEQACCWICLERGPVAGGASSAGAAAGAVATPAPAGGALEKLCACPSRYVHRKCLARWQLQCAGTPEENACRFCHCELPCWRRSLAASLSIPEAPIIRRRACTPQTPSSGGGSSTATPSATPSTAAAGSGWGRLFRSRGGAVSSSTSAQGPVIALHLNSRTCHIEVPPGCSLEMFKASVRRRLGLAPNQFFDLNFLIELEPGEKVMLKGVTRSPANFEAAVFCATLSAARRTRGGWGGGGGGAAATFNAGRGWRQVVAAVSGAVAKTRAALHRGRRQRTHGADSTAAGRDNISGDEGPSSSAAAAVDATAASRPDSECRRPVSPPQVLPAATGPAAPLVDA